MKILFFGTPQFAVPSLKLLKERLIGVVTRPDRPGGRGLRIMPSPVKLAAQIYNLPVYQPESVSNHVFIDKLRGMGIDLIIVVAFGEILSKDILDIPKIGCINLHASLLPKYRGASPVARALMKGEQVTGLTTFWLEEGIDSGDIIFQEKVPILEGDTRGILEERMSGQGGRLLLKTVKDGLGTRIPQDDSCAVYAPKLKKSERIINWQEDAAVIHNKIRAMNPRPGAYTFLGGKKLVILDSAITAGEWGRPGAIVSINKGGIGVSAKTGILIVKKLQIEGKNIISAQDFINGYRIKIGTLLSGAV